MPLAQISLIEGRDAETKRALVAAVTDAIAETLGSDRKSVRVLLYELPPEHWGVAGTTKEASR